MVQGELNQEPSPEGTVVQNPPTAPQNDGQFLQKYKWWIIGGAVIAAVATGGIVLYMCMPAAAGVGAVVASAGTTAASAGTTAASAGTTAASAGTIAASAGTTAASAGTTAASVHTATVTTSVTVLISMVIRRGK